MRQLGCLLSLVSCTLFSVTAHAWPANTTSAVERQVTAAPHDWPWWRGPGQDGVAPPSDDVVTEWNEETNVLWKTPIPGRGHGSATVAGERVYLATAESAPEQQSVYCLDRESGRVIWKTVVHQGGQTTKGNKKASQASSTPAWDGEQLYISFLNRDQIVTTALDESGKIVWQTPVSDYVVHQGYGASPTIYGPLVIISADNKGGGAVAGLQRDSGRIVWKRPRPKKPNYASPIVLHIDGRDQLILTGCDLVTSLNPLTGEPNWEVEGATTECVTSTVTDGTHVYSSGGYPDNHVAAIRADGSGETAWRERTRVYVPSMLIHEGNLYAVTDAGVAMCWDAATGKALWKGRLGGTFSASPVLAGNTIYAVNETGTTYLFQADPESFQLLGENQLGDHVMATPTICGGRIFVRVAHEVQGRRQEMLYCLGK